MKEDLTSPETKVAIYQRFINDRPEGGEVAAWIAGVAAQEGVTPSTVRNWIDRQQELAFFEGPNHVQSIFEALAHQADVYAIDAIRTLGKNLTAGRQVKKKTRDGEVLEFYEEDFNAQNVAAEKILKIYGAFAPDKIELSRGAGDPRTMTDQELEDELRKYNESRGKKVIQIKADDSDSPAGTGKTITPREGGSPASGGEESQVLADPLHEDGG